MKAAVAVLCALAGIPGGMLANLLVERIPEKQRLRPFPPAKTMAATKLQVATIVATVAPVSYTHLTLPTTERV